MNNPTVLEDSRIAELEQETTSFLKRFKDSKLGPLKGKNSQAHIEVLEQLSSIVDGFTVGNLMHYLTFNPSGSFVNEVSGQLSLDDKQTQGGYWYFDSSRKRFDVNLTEDNVSAIIQANSDPKDGEDIQYKASVFFNNESITL